jgi:hypothetical protein
MHGHRAARGSLDGFDAAPIGDAHSRAIDDERSHNRNRQRQDPGPDEVELAQQQATHQRR